MLIKMILSLLVFSTFSVRAQILYYDVEFREFNEEEKLKVHLALEAIVKAVESDEFKNFVRHFTYKGKKQFAENRGFTNEKILQTILDGAENFRPIADQTINLKLNLYYTRNSTVGYTYPNTDQIFINDYFFSRYQVHEVARNLFHEWLHKLGFDHKSRSKKVRPYSVPYALGNKMMELVKTQEI